MFICFISHTCLLKLFRASDGRKYNFRFDIFEKGLSPPSCGPVVNICRSHDVHLTLTRPQRHREAHFISPTPSSLLFFNSTIVGHDSQ